MKYNNNNNNNNLRRHIAPLSEWTHPRGNSLKVIPDLERMLRMFGANITKIGPQKASAQYCRLLMWRAESGKRFKLKQCFVAVYLERPNVQWLNVFMSLQEHTWTLRRVPLRAVGDGSCFCGACHLFYGLSSIIFFPQRSPLMMD